jgi:hypothetical protein
VGQRTVQRNMAVGRASLYSGITPPCGITNPLAQPHYTVAAVLCALVWVLGFPGNWFISLYLVRRVMSLWRPGFRLDGLWL